jgi:hypothetical protein
MILIGTKDDGKTSNFIIWAYWEQESDSYFKNSTVSSFLDTFLEEPLKVPEFLQGLSLEHRALGDL